MLDVTPLIVQCEKRMSQTRARLGSSTESIQKTTEMLRTTERVLANSRMRLRPEPQRNEARPFDWFLPR